MKYPIGIQQFEKLREEGWVYVDKTIHIHRMVSKGTYFFLSRPRRFGKSLLMSTIETYFKGKKEFFKGLSIEKLEKDWNEHPVLHLDLNAERYATTDELNNILDTYLREWEKLYGSEEGNNESLSRRFLAVIRAAKQKTGRNVVVLIDEYDKPMLQAIGNEELRKRYDGYHFSANAKGIYNPFSILLALKNKNYGSYWFSTGTPTYLVELLKKFDFKLENLSGYEASANTLDSIQLSVDNPIPVLYQSGYLTIKDYDKEFKLYILDFPNEEVEEGFINFLIPIYTSVSETDSPVFIGNFVRELRAGKVNDFMKRMQLMMADTPYEIIKDLESHYQNVMFIMTRLMGFYVQAEYRTSSYGRIDLLITTENYIYVIEIELNGIAEEALAQINDKEYTLPFTADKRRVVKVGAKISREKRNLENWVVEY